MQKKYRVGDTAESPLRVPVRVLFDTTVLCSAIRDLDGLSMKLLLLARTGFVEPIITEEILIEWIRNCYQGIGKVIYDEKDIEAFCQLLEPLLASNMIASVDLSRFASPLYPMTEQSGMKLIQHPIGYSRTITHMLNNRTLALTDIDDFHVVAAALKYQCSYLCTYNLKDLPDGLKIGIITVIRPERLYRKLTEENWNSSTFLGKNN